jgi:signal peptidase I
MHHNRRNLPAVWWLSAVPLGGVLALYVLGLRVSRFVVSGASMQPTLADGDRLLVLRGPARLLGLRRGLLVVARPDALGGREVVKRIAGVVAPTNERRFVLLGDNARWSTDSRAYGPVSGAEIRGRALLRYWPDHRRGPVR